MLIAEALEEISEQHGGLDQYQLAHTLNVSQGTISNYYKGRSYPTLGIAARIYNEYGYRCEPFTEWALKDYAEKYLK